MVKGGGAGFARRRPRRGDRADLDPGRRAGAGWARADGAAGGRRAGVRGPGAGQADAVDRVVNPEHEEWECDCPSKEAVCSHVVAAVLATEQAGGGVPTRRERWRTLRYLLEPDPGGVRVERLLVQRRPHGGARRIADDARRQWQGGGGIATQEYRPARRSDRSRREQADQRRQLDRLLAVLADASDVRWRGDAGQDERRAGVPRASSTTTTTAACACGSSPTRRSREVVARRRRAHARQRAAADRRGRSRGARLEKLPQHVRRPARRAARAARQDAARARAADPDRDPRDAACRSSARAKSRACSSTSTQDGDKLVVFPTLVYGDPPRARVDGRTPRPPRTARCRSATRTPSAGSSIACATSSTSCPGRRVELVGREAFAMQQRLAELAAQRREGGRAPRSRAARARDRRRRRRLDVDVCVAGGGAQRVGRRGAARVAGRRRRRAARRRRLGPRADGVVRQARRARSPICSRRAAAIARVPIYALPDLARALRATSISRRRPSSSALRPLLAGFAGIPHADAAAGLRRRAAPVPAARRRLARVLPRRRPRLRARRRHGPRQDDPGARRDPRGRRRSSCRPKSVLFNWLAEIARFRPDLRVATYHGTRRALDPTADVVAHELSDPAQRRRARSRAVAWDTVDPRRVAGDQEPRHPGRARRVRAARRGWQLTLSGTPVENRLDELWSQLHFTNPGLLGGRADFHERWAEPIALGDQRRGRAPARAHPAVRAAPHEARRRDGAAAAHRRGHVRRARRGRARRLRRDPRGDPARDRRSCSRPAAA